MTDLFKGFGVAVAELSREDFLKVRETLSRIGTVSENNVLTQHCFILHKRGMYAVMHAAELEAMDGSDKKPSDDEIGVRNTVAYLLDQWGLLKITDPDTVSSPRAPVGKLVVVPYKKRNEFTFKAAYEIGKRR